MKIKSISIFFLSVLITVFVLGIVYVQAQDEQKEGTEKEGSNEKELEVKQKELTEDELKAKVAELVKMLSSDDFKEREKAKNELIKLGEKIVKYLIEIEKITEDLEVKSKIKEVIATFNEAKEKAEAEKKNKESKPLKGFKYRIVIGNVKYSINDGTGIYKLEKTKEGKFKVTSLPNGGEEEIREFDSMEEFEEKWPKVYEKFKHIKIVPVKPPQEPEDDDEEDIEPWGEPEGEEDEDERDDGLGFPGFPHELEELEKEMERLRKEFEKRFRDELEREVDPKKGEQGHRQLFRSSRKDVEGNEYNLLIENGKVTAEFKSKDGGTETRKFESYVEFKKGWPEFAELFPNLDKEYKPFTPEPNEAEKPKNQVEDAVFDSVSEVLRSQLQIKEGEGILIKELIGELEEKQGFFKKAGLEKYDILLEVNGESITSFKFLETKFALLKDGEKLVLKFIRKGLRQDITITK